MKKISLFLFTVLITLLSCSDLSENNGSNVNAEVCKPSDVFVYSGGNVITTRMGVIMYGILSVLMVIYQVKMKGQPKGKQ